MRLLILEHYRRNGILEGWEPWRVGRLARLLNINLDELGVLCGIIHKVNGGFYRGHIRLMMEADGRVPPWASLHMAYLEAWVVDKLKLNIQTTPNAMPLDLITTPRKLVEAAAEGRDMMKV